MPAEIHFFSTLVKEHVEQRVYKADIEKGEQA